MSASEQRFELLKQWLDPVLASIFAVNDWGDVPQVDLQPASSDASFRRYFRWESEQLSLIVMDAPPPQEDCRPFVAMAEHLARAGLQVPIIFAADLDQGFLLLSDLGRQTYLDVIRPDNADQLFADAIEALLALQCLPHDIQLPAYDQTLLARELQLFPDWYLAKHLGVTLDGELLARWQRVSQLLIESALVQSTTLVHRDFMPRNLMLSEPNPGVLDFQDAVYGPISYDITCLFKDAFISWPQDKVEGWLQRYWQKAQAQGLPVPASFAEFYRACDLMGVQRHLKVIGIFARICYRDGKPKYLEDAPRFFNYIREVLVRRPELAELGQLLDELGLGAQA